MNNIESRDIKPQRLDRICFGVCQIPKLSTHGAPTACCFSTQYGEPSSIFPRYVSIMRLKLVRYICFILYICCLRESTYSWILHFFANEIFYVIRKFRNDDIMIMKLNSNSDNLLLAFFNVNIIFDLFYMVE